MSVMYKTVDQGGDRHVIIDGESRVDEMRVTPNLANDQFKIELLIADDCPIRTSCVRIEEGVNSICNHLGYDSVDLKELLCQYGASSKTRVVNELWVEGCPLGKNCAKCKDLRSISIPPSFQPEKSHAYITCKTRHRKKGS
jgi:hypothetical protein